MVYFPAVGELPKPAKCPGCGGWYVPQSGPVTVSCCVMHPPGTCCHYGETKVDPPKEAR